MTTVAAIFKNKDSSLLAKSHHQISPNLYAITNCIIYEKNNYFKLPATCRCHIGAALITLAFFEGILLRNRITETLYIFLIHADDKTIILYHE